MFYSDIAIVLKFKYRYIILIFFINFILYQFENLLSIYYLRSCQWRYKSNWTHNSYCNYSVSTSNNNCNCYSYSLDNMVHFKTQHKEASAVKVYIMLCCLS